MRWKQDPITHKLIPIDEGARKRDGHYIHNDLASFVSPVDGSVISDRKQLREHNKKNNVVSADEFDQSHYEAAAKKREDHYAGRVSRKEKFKRRQVLYDNWIQAERDAGIH